MGSLGESYAGMAWCYLPLRKFFEKGVPDLARAISYPSQFTKYTIMVHGLHWSPSFALDVATPPISTTDVTLPHSSTADAALPPQCTKDVTLPPFSSEDIPCP
ncbi:uncharacterized [Tachysurus ichikawai]